MTVNDTLDHFGASAASKAANLRENPLAFMVSALMAGAYVGIGILLILSVGQGLDPSVRPLVMGASFGIALTPAAHDMYILRALVGMTYEFSIY